MKAPNRKKTSADWHPADIVAALRKAGWSLRKLSKHHGYCPTSLTAALHRPWPKAERLIADAIGVSAEDIWPSRYASRAQKHSNDGTKTRVKVRRVA